MQGRDRVTIFYRYQPTADCITRNIQNRCLNIDFISEDKNANEVRMFLVLCEVQIWIVTAARVFLIDFQYVDTRSCELGLYVCLLTEYNV